MIGLTSLLARKIWQLVRDYRAHVPGSRLTARTVAIFGALVIAPLLIVYLFSLEFLNRGIDSWFRVEIKQGLNDALRAVARGARPAHARVLAAHRDARARARRQPAARSGSARSTTERRATGALEIVLFGAHERVHRREHARTRSRTLPRRRPPDLLRQVGAAPPYVEPRAAGGRRVPDPHRRAASRCRDAGATERYRRARSTRCRRSSPRSSEAVQQLLFAVRRPGGAARAAEEQLPPDPHAGAAAGDARRHLRRDLSAQRLVRPVQDLIAGTRAVGKGDFGTRLPLPSRDEMGFLVHSFNDMTKRLRRAREEATRSQQAVERERERLAIILARLSTGVIAVDRELTVRSANQAAGAILGADLLGRRRPLAAAARRRQRAPRPVRRGARGALRRRARGVARAARSRRRRRAPRADVRLHAAAGVEDSERGLRHRVRRHHRAAAGAARCRLGRGGAPPGARDQESAHADPAVGRAHAAQACSPA